MLTETEGGRAVYSVQAFILYEELSELVVLAAVDA